MSKLLKLLLIMVLAALLAGSVSAGKPRKLPASAYIKSAKIHILSGNTERYEQAVAMLDSLFMYYGPNAEGLYWMVDYQTCTGCQACIGACPFDAMLYDPTADRVIKCDTCDGNPTCADICPTGALRWGNAEEERR